MIAAPSVVGSGIHDFGSVLFLDSIVKKVTSGDKTNFSFLREFFEKLIELKCKIKLAKKSFKHFAFAK